MYIGEWMQNDKCGYGCFYKDGILIYEGDFFANYRSGFGIKYGKNGVKEYEGEWKFDYPFGKGTRYYGDKYY